MGLFDNLSKKAKEAADSARKAAEEAMEQAKAVSEELAVKAKAVSEDLAEKAKAASEDLAEKAKVASDDLSEKFNAGTKDLSAWAKSMPAKLRGMADDFDAEALWDKLAKTAAKAGQELIVMVLTIYYAVESKIPSKEQKK